MENTVVHGILREGRVIYGVKPWSAWFVSDLFGHLAERSNHSFMGITHISAKDFRMLLAVNISHVHV